MKRRGKGEEISEGNHLEAGFLLAGTIWWPVPPSPIQAFAMMMKKEEESESVTKERKDEEEEKEKGVEPEPNVGK